MGSPWLYVGVVLAILCGLGIAFADRFRTPSMAKLVPNAEPPVPVAVLPDRIPEKNVPDMELPPIIPAPEKSVPDMETPPPIIPAPEDSIDAGPNAGWGDVPARLAPKSMESGRTCTIHASRRFGDSTSLKMEGVFFESFEGTSVPVMLRVRSARIALKGTLHGKVVNLTAADADARGWGPTYQGVQNGHRTWGQPPLLPPNCTPEFAQAIREANWAFDWSSFTVMTHTLKVGEEWNPSIKIFAADGVFSKGVEYELKLKLLGTRMAPKPEALCQIVGNPGRGGGQGVDIQGKAIFDLTGGYWSRVELKFRQEASEVPSEAEIRIRRVLGNTEGVAPNLAEKKF